ncbi:MAG: hypothetical protein IJA44_04570 [Clostridia bacterium]|nr:hypothetical protein [Clostridia bacterium]
MDKLKPWLYSILPNIFFFGFFCGAIILEAATHINTNETGDIFLYLLPVFLIFYSWFTYKNTRKFAIPVVCFAVIMFVFLFVTDYYTAAFSGFYVYNNDVLLGVSIIFAIFTLVPTITLLLLQLIMKLIFKKRNI